MLIRNLSFHFRSLPPCLPWRASLWWVQRVVSSYALVFWASFSLTAYEEPLHSQFPFHWPFAYLLCAGPWLSLTLVSWSLPLFISSVTVSTYFPFSSKCCRSYCAGWGLCSVPSLTPIPRLWPRTWHYGLGKGKPPALFTLLESSRASLAPVRCSSAEEGLGPIIFSW